MKKFKKLLAVVLVVALAFSLMATVSAANVTDYSDADDVTYTEAVDLFTALGFLAGMGDGTFDPTGLVTREQAAKIITYMLIGSNRADALTTAISSFTDVAVTRWSAPYIEYCAALGIINGRGDGTFNPEGNVTGTEFAKMLLCAIGYGVNGECTGANWAMKTIADAQSLDILSLAVDYSAAATREECAQYGFNAYTKCNEVVWNRTTEAYQQAIDIDGVTSKGTLATQQSVDKTTFVYTQNGTTYYKWAKDGAEITEGYSKDKVLGTSTDGTSISKLTDSAETKYLATLDTSYTCYHNGAVVPALSLTSGVTTAATTFNQLFNYGGVVYRVTTVSVIGSTPAQVIANSTDLSAIKGVVVKLISTDTDSKAEAVLVVEKTAAYLSSAPIVNSTNSTVTIAGVLSSVSTSKVEGFSDLASGDVVLWYKDNAGNYHLEKATSAAGSMSNHIMSWRLRCCWWRILLLFRLIKPSFTIADTWLNSECTICSTTAAILSTPQQHRHSVTNPASAYGFVIAHETKFRHWAATQANAVFSDGTTSIITLASNSALYGVTTGTDIRSTDSQELCGAYVLTAVVNDTAVCYGLRNSKSHRGHLRAEQYAWVTGANTPGNYKGLCYVSDRSNQLP
jgi:hypothetical protein